MGATLPPDRAEYTALYIHYEERGAEIRGQMISAITFLYTVIVALVGLLGSWMFALPAGIETPLAFAVALVGLPLSALSLLLVLDFRAHMGRSYALSKQVLTTCPGLKNVVEQLRAASRGQDLGVYRDKAKIEDELEWLDARRLLRLFRVEPIFLMVSTGATAFFGFGVWRAYVS